MKITPEYYKKLQYSAIGIEMAASIVVGGLIGYGLDWLMLSKFGYKTEPWLFLIWMIFGIIAGFRALYRVTIKFQNESAKGNEDVDKNDEGSTGT